MYQVSEWQPVGNSKRCFKTYRHLQSFSVQEEAIRFSDTAYQELQRIPESEEIWVGVLDEETGRIVYRQPPLTPGDPANGR